MSRLKRIFKWCPQPNKPTYANLTRLSAPVFGSVLLVEIVALLIVPLAYVALFVPKNIVVTDQVLPDQTLPLTNSQINTAWPNLPTAQEIVNGSYSFGGYSIITSSMPTFKDVKNYTWISPGNAVPSKIPSGVLATRLVPIEYHVWLKLNDTTWVCPEDYLLTTQSPPYSLPSPLYYSYTKEGGFLGTGLPAAYVLVAVIAIAATATTGATYLTFHRRHNQKIIGE